MASRNTVRFEWDSLERNRNNVEKVFPGIVLPDTYSIKKITSSSTSPNLSNRVPNVPEYESQDSKLKRYGVTGTELLERGTYHQAPVISGIMADVPVARNITQLKQLRADHRVFYNVGTGVVECVVTQKDVAALTFYRRYYMNTPQIAEVRGSVFRKIGSKKHNMLTANGVGIKWLTKENMAKYLVSFQPQVGVEYNIVTDIRADFAPLINDRPVLDQSRVRFVFVRYYSREVKVSAE